MHIMKQKRVSRWLINWIFFFMLNRKITLVFDNQKSEILDIFVKIFQNLLLLLIFFLFYNTKLLNICNSTKIRISSLKFVNDVNLLVYRKITENNCKQLKLIHDKYLIWAKKYKIFFASEKYVLIYFSW